ncbi:MAG TPA: hypothetical protein VK157_17285 [Phycisphaerales bacterium]|nr:hypothetical protein [Phycisphaerales bacterium]
MRFGPPPLIAIDHDDDHAEFVGMLQDGRQFFLTTPFEPAIGDSAGCEFVALYLFSAGGQLLEARIENLGPRATMDRQRRSTLMDEWLRGLGSVHFGRIEVAPFAVERFGTTFGLVPRAPETDEDNWVVEAEPGNYMAFFEPWDSGMYDT